MNLFCVRTKETCKRPQVYTICMQITGLPCGTSVHTGLGRCDGTALSISSNTALLKRTGFSGMKHLVVTGVTSACEKQNAERLLLKPYLLKKQTTHNMYCNKQVSLGHYCVEAVRENHDEKVWNTNTIFKVSPSCSCQQLSSQKGLTDVARWLLPSPPPLVQRFSQGLMSWETSVPLVVVPPVPGKQTSTATDRESPYRQHHSGGPAV